MDFFPRPYEPRCPHFEVPFVARLQYDGQGFEDFLARNNFKRADLQNASAGDLASAIQAWLYFALLSDFTGRELRLEDFRQRSTSSTSDVVSLQPVVAIFQEPQWYASFKLSVRAQRHGKCNVKDSKCLCKRLRWAWGRLNRYERSAANSDQHVRRIFLSIRILINTLYLMVHRHTSRRPNLEDSAWEPYWGVQEFNPLRSKGQRLDGASHELIEMLKASGLCISFARYACTVFDWVTLYYMSQISFASTTLHEKCSSVECVAYNTNEDQYESAHTKTGCTCDFIGIPSDQIARIIDDNKIPLCRVVRDSSGTVSLSVEEATWRSAYIALSHVWIDGLGNPRANAIPTCQLQQIQTYLTSTPEVGLFGGFLEHVKKTMTGARSDGPKTISQRLASCLGVAAESRELFWLDTLCVPVSEEHKHLRQRAITHMDAIYAGAQQVLLLDSQLALKEIPSSHYADVLARIVTSAWASRCWTLQEGALSREQHVKFSNGFIDPSGDQPRPPDAPWMFSQTDFCMNDLHRLARIITCKCLELIREKELGRPLRYLAWGYSNPDKCQVSVLVTVQRRLQAFFRDNLEVLDTAPPSAESSPSKWRTPCRRFVQVWNALSVRSTTKREDLFVILANLLHLRASDLLRYASGAEKMRAILLAIGDVPAELLQNDGQRLRPSEEHNDRWLPTETSTFHLGVGPLWRMSIDAVHLTIRESYLIFLNFKDFRGGSTSFLLELNKEKVEVVLQRAVEDDFVLSDQVESAIIINPRHSTFDDKETHGALLHVLKRETSAARRGADSKKEDVLITKYDCPLTMRIRAKAAIEKPQDDDPTQLALPLVHGRSIEPGEMIVKIRTDTPANFQPASRRPARERPSAIIPFANVFLVFHISSCYCSLGLTAAIMAKGPWGHLPVAARVFGVLNCLFGYMPPLDMILVALFLGLVWGSDGNFGHLHLVLLVIKAVDVAVTYLVAYFVIHGYLYYSYIRWMASFGVDWGHTRRQRFWMRFFEMNDWLWSWEREDFWEKQWEGSFLAQWSKKAERCMERVRSSFS